MTRQELVDALTVERFTPTWVAFPKPPAEGGWDDSEITTARRRRELDDALEGFDVPTSGPVYGVRVHQGGLNGA